MSFGQFFSILRARWLVAAIVFLATIGTTLIISLLLPKQYSSVASVVIDAKPDPISAMMYPGMASPGYMATQVDVIQSDRVAQRVVRNLKLTENAQIRQQWMAETKGEGAIENWLAETFQKNLEVRPARESSVIQVSYRAPDPRFSAALANAFVQAYVDTSLELKVDPARQYNAFFDTKAKEAREVLEAAQAKVSTYQREKGIIATDERLDIETARLNELSSQLVMLQAVSAESSSRQTQAQGSSADRLQEVLNNPVVSALKAEISRNEARLQELSSRFGDSHPQIIELKANTAELRAKMEAETRRVTGGVTVSNTINRQREAEIRASLAAQRANVLRMKEVRDEGSVLNREVENAQRAYDAVMARANQTNLESQTTQSNVSILTRASPPLQPSSPKIVLNTLLSVFLGALLAIGAIFMLEMLDRRVRGSEDILQTMGLPILGVLPRPDAKKLFGRANAKPMFEQRLLAHLPTASKSA
ncbi:chain length determinant protein EpsF [Roseateles toxinivorans]|uniref:Chain length determinant protein EpsF n=1 Tax=Roseateles toxinivorans TaxID=270368 RepID=A0A4R6QJS0_9BURK|nr:chain length determinant protein EpsF [Roseateles toxinivorans]TDP63351.1 chain length determinant protein EpsF [Roseateles toxinivorans]